MRVEVFVFPHFYSNRTWRNFIGTLAADGFFFLFIFIFFFVQMSAASVIYEIPGIILIIFLFVYSNLNLVLEILNQ